MELKLNIYENFDDTITIGGYMKQLSDEQVEALGALAMRELGARVGLEQSMEVIFQTALNGSISRRER